MTRLMAGQQGPAQEARLADGGRAQTRGGGRWCRRLPELTLLLFSSLEGCVVTVTVAESGDMVVDM